LYSDGDAFSFPHCPGDCDCDEGGYDRPIGWSLPGASLVTWTILAVINWCLTAKIT
jgi:hypothetical protein